MRSFFLAWKIIKKSFAIRGAICYCHLHKSFFFLMQRRRQKALAAFFLLCTGAANQLLMWPLFLFFATAAKCLLGPYRIVCTLYLRRHQWRTFWESFTLYRLWKRLLLPVFNFLKKSHWMFHLSEYILKKKLRNLNLKLAVKHKQCHNFSRTKIVKIQKLKCDNFDNFQTLCFMWRNAIIFVFNQLVGRWC